MSSPRPPPKTSPKPSPRPAGAKPPPPRPPPKPPPGPPPGTFMHAAAKLLASPTFEHSMGAVIMMNMVIIMVETDHAAENEGTLAWVDAVGWSILIIFVLELIVRLSVHRSSFWYDGWNTFDFTIVVTDAAFSILGLIFGAVFPVSTLRVFRLCKLARISKVFRVFPELRIMMAGLMGSFRAIFWGTVLLGFVLLVWAIVAVQFIHPLNKELAESGVLDGCERCPRAYRSVLQSTLTFSQQIVCGDSWGQATIPLIEAHPWTAFYFMAVFLSVGVAVMNLILGVVVGVAQAEHDRLKGELADEAELGKMLASGNLLDICAEMDGDGSGELSKEELLEGYDKREDFRDAIAEMSLKKEDLAMAFVSMDADKSGAVSYTEFVNKIYKLKDTDTTFSLEQIKYNLNIVREALTSQNTELDSIESAQSNFITQSELSFGVMENEMKALEEKAGMGGRLGGRPQGKSPNQPLVGGAKSPSVSETGGLSDRKLLSARKDETAPGEGQMTTEILSSLENVSQHLQGEFRETLGRIAACLERHEASLERIAQNPGKPMYATQATGGSAGDDLVALPGRGANGQFCCAVRQV